MADALVAANGAERGGVINNSWGTNIRTKEVYKWSAEKEDWVWDHYVTPGRRYVQVRDRRRS